MMNQRTFSERADGARGLPTSLLRFCQRAFAVGIVVTGVVASVATSCDILIPQLRSSRAIPSFVLGDDEEMGVVIVVQMNQEAFADDDDGFIDVTLSIGVACTTVEDDSCAEMQEGVQVGMVFTEIDALGLAVAEPQFARLSRDLTSTQIPAWHHPISRVNSSVTYAFEVQRSDNVGGALPMIASVHTAFSFGEGIEIPEAASIAIDFEDVPADFVFPSAPIVDGDGGIVDDDAGIAEADAGVADGDGGVVDAG